MVVFDVCARRRRGTDAERKSTSSVIGPYSDLVFCVNYRGRTYGNKVTPAHPAS